METRAMDCGLQCSQCNFITETTNDELKLRNHCKYYHPEVEFRIKNFRTLQKGNVVKSAAVNVKTLQKRIRTAVRLGCENSTPRQCSHINNKEKRCSLFIISSAESKHVRCFNHPLHDLEFARKRGVFGNSLSYVTLKPSSVVGGGNGVFTTSLGSYRKGDFITQYVGTLLSKEQVLENQHNPEYTLLCSSFSLPYLNGINQPIVGKGIGSFINRRNEENSANAKFVYRFAKTAEESVWIVAEKDIKSGEEIFISYGNSFKIHV
jgi:hypothetical protein